MEMKKLRIFREQGKCHMGSLFVRDRYYLSCCEMIVDMHECRYGTQVEGYLRHATAAGGPALPQDQQSVTAGPDVGTSLTFKEAAVLGGVISFGFEMRIGLSYPIIGCLVANGDE